MNTLRMTGLLTLALAASLAAQGAQKGTTQKHNLTGRWTVTTSADGPHGAVAMPLVLKQEGKRVIGSLTPPGGSEIPLEGEFDGVTLTLADPSGERVTMNAKLQANGTLNGYTSTSRGDLTWTAERVKSQGKP